MIDPALRIAPLWHMNPDNVVVSNYFDKGTKGGVEIRRFFFHLFVVMKSHITSSQNRCAGCLACKV
ncbi:MAG: hypothetical protein SRB1_01689 [Desulfobacteraceae bacterium Eth-SRB1]|nr:MAG: hypothetical protein SRB1_01689 [Desulfobacteraceae bacterium Eth-SRB1]